MMAVTPELLARHDRPGPRYTSYPTAVEFTPNVGRRQYHRRLHEASRSTAPFSLYVHLPFCEARCSFCACHVVTTKNRGIIGRYLDRLDREAAMVGSRLGERRALVQYHWGGGTPTFYPAHLLEALHRRLLEHFTLKPGAEVAVEVDPRVTTQRHLEVLAELGFNRLSAGVQDLDPEVQRLIGRHQTRQQTEALVHGARRLGFRSINLDLIYGLPGQTVDTFDATLEGIIGLRPERLAVYSFAHVPRVRPHQKRIDASLLPHRETKFRLFCRALTTLTEAGYVYVGMDHFALPGDELAVAAAEGTLTRNFMGYTAHRGTEVVALGTSGISDLAGAYVQNHRRLFSYQADVDAGRIPVERGVALTMDDLIRRQVITDLMCRGWVDLAAVGEGFEIDAERYFAAELADLARPEGLVEEGLAVVDGARVAATEVGRVFIRRLAMAFDAYLPGTEGKAPRFSRVI